MKESPNADHNRSRSRSSDAGGVDGLEGILPNRLSPVKDQSRGSPNRSSSPRRVQFPDEYAQSRGAEDLEHYAEANYRIRSNSTAKREMIQEQRMEERRKIEEAEKAEEEKLREQREAYQKFLAMQQQ